MNIHQAARSGDRETVLKLLKVGVSVNAREEHSLQVTPLMAAASSHECGVEMLKLLVEHGANLNLITNFGRFAALNFAAHNLEKSIPSGRRGRTIHRRSKIQGLSL